ncbi:hypothetical protein OLP40_07495 [Campylobacter jejuni]|nr:hypothetical protein [Campylobacter jejuni]MCW1359302.1 hypothetical protein [Campylobacter jejuni]
MKFLKLSTDVNYQIENFSKIYTKAASKTSTQQLIDETKISVKSFSGWFYSISYKFFMLFMILGKL